MNWWMWLCRINHTDKMKQEKTEAVMKITDGLWNRMVIRRNSKNVSAQPFAGICSGKGDVVAVVTDAKGKTVPSFHGIVCGSAVGGKFSGTLSGLKSGGPYRITLSIGNESATVEDLLVGDVWLLGGQSNMQGYGNLDNAVRACSPMIRAYTMDDRWGLAKEPVIQPHIANAPVHWRRMGIAQPEPPRKWRDPFHKGVGPGISFANEMFRKTGVPQGLIACAHGGTTMEEWNPKLKSRGDDSLYGAMMNRIRRNGGLVSGMVWYQGCSDATSERVPLFRRRMIDFIRSLRKDLQFPEMPFVQVQISRLVNSQDSGNHFWTEIREIQRTLPHKVRNLLTVSAIDLELDDNIHLSGTAQGILGKRLGEAMQTLLGMKNALPPPPDFASIRRKPHPKAIENLVVVKFRNIVGKLESDGRPSGFSCNQSLTDQCFRTELKGDCVILHCDPSLAISDIAYGYGCNPYCNLRDSAGRPLPAFAPQSICGNRFKTPYTRMMEVSAPLSGSEDLDALTLTDAQNLPYARPHQTGPFVIPEDRENVASTKGIRFFRSAFTVTEPMELHLLLGYDGPVKLFCDGKEIYVDKKGTNPVIPESHSVDVAWETGRHELVIALALNQGAAWGVSLCIARADRKRSRNTIATPALPEEIRF